MLKINHNKILIVGIITAITVGATMCGCGGSQDKQASNTSKLTSEIDKLPTATEVTAKDADAITQVKNEYDKLSKDEQKEVKNADKLNLDEEALKSIENDTNAINDDFKKSEQVSQEIKNLNVNDKNQVEKVKKDYESLTDAQKELVQDIDKIQH